MGAQLSSHALCPCKVARNEVTCIVNLLDDQLTFIFSLFQFYFIYRILIYICYNFFYTVHEISPEISENSLHLILKLNFCRI